MRSGCVTSRENGQIIYRNVEEQNQRGVADHRDVKRHGVLDKTAGRECRWSCQCVAANVGLTCWFETKKHSQAVWVV